MDNIGHLKSLCPLWTTLAKSHRYRNFLDERDIREFEVRSVNEGLHFLTITLPRLGKALDEFHSTTVWNPPSNFKLDEESIPLFMGRVIRLALGGSSQAVECVRQLTFIFYRLEVDYDKALVADTLERFERTDLEIQQAVSCFDVQTSIQDHLTRMRRMICEVLAKANPYDIRPCHGSGATACRTKNKDKWHVLRYYPKLDAVFPYADYFFYSMTHLSDELQKLENSAESIPRARVVLVPKDSRGPRVISCEPAELMFIQQGLMRKLYRVIENHPLTTGQIHFSDQRPNKLAAFAASLHSGDDNATATLDLKDASDRLSLELVRRVFPSNWLECLEASRSEETILPNGKVIKLNKFAPMGSACCFPVEALVFWASVQASCEYLGVKTKVLVYGDDIICPTKITGQVIEDLVSIGLKVNATKSFFRGPFRESCGGDFHLGEDVTPIRLEKSLDKSHTSIATAADLANHLVSRFGYADALSSLNLIESAIGYVFPRTELDIPCTVRGPSNSNDAHFRKRWSKNLQRFEHRVLQLSTQVLSCRKETWSELLRQELTVAHRSNRAGQLFSLEVPDGRLRPGQYAVGHSARQKWQWVWLG